MTRAINERPVDMLLFCPKCGVQHVDGVEDHEVDHGSHVEVVADWMNPPHRSHLCHACGCIWRPADVPTNGVAALQTRGEADTWGAHSARGPFDPERLWRSLTYTQQARTSPKNVADALAALRNHDGA